MSKLIISTLNWNGKDKLEKLYPSLINSLNGIDYQWVIKDNASIDGSLELIKSWNNDKINLIEYPHNRDNFSQGVNLTIKEANPNNDDLILLLNNDVIFNDNTSIKKMIDIIKKDNDVGIVGAKLLNQYNKINHAGVVFVPNIHTPTHHLAGKDDSQFSNKNRYFQAITGAVLLTKANLFKEVNGLPEEMVWCFDDIYYCLLINKDLNKKVIYCGETNIFHEESASLKKNPVNKLFLKQNIINFKRRWFGKYEIDKHLYEKNVNYNLYKK